MGTTSWLLRGGRLIEAQSGNATGGRQTKKLAAGLFGEAVLLEGVFSLLIRRGADNPPGSDALCGVVQTHHHPGKAKRSLSFESPTP